MRIRRYANAYAKCKEYIYIELDLRQISINKSTLPVILRALLDKIDMLESSHDDMLKENDTIKSSLEYAHSRNADLEKREKEREIEMSKMQAKVESFENDSKRFKVDNERLKEKSLKSESFSRRMNLRFEGINMPQDESPAQCRNKVYEILK